MYTRGSKSVLSFILPEIQHMIENDSNAEKENLKTLNDLVLSKAPAAVAVAGTALPPGAPGLTLGGTLVVADTAGRIVVDSKVLLPTSTSLFTTTIGG